MEDSLSIGVVVVLIGDLLVVVLVFLVYLVGCFFVYCYWLLLLLLVVVVGMVARSILAVGFVYICCNTLLNLSFDKVNHFW